MTWLSIIDFAFSLLGGLAVAAIAFVIGYQWCKIKLFRAVNDLICEAQDYCIGGNDKILEIARARISILRKIRAMI